MLGKQYRFYRDCCVKYVTKQQVLGVQCTNSGAIPAQTKNQTIPQNSYQHLPVKEEKQVYFEGKMYHNTYMNYCMCFSCSYCRQNTIEIEMNNQKVTETKIPNCCPMYGPYTVHGKHEQLIGELRPKWYICHYCTYNMCHPCCAQLQLHDQSLNHIYTIKRQPCTCLCCTKWTVLDTTLNIRSQFEQVGCCFADLKMSLPDDKQVNKKLVMSSIGFLP